MNVQCQSDNTFFRFLPHFFFLSISVFFVSIHSHALPELPFCLVCVTMKEEKNLIYVSRCLLDSVPLRTCFLIRNLWFVVRLCNSIRKCFVIIEIFFSSFTLHVRLLALILSFSFFLSFPWVAFVQLRLQ